MESTNYQKPSKKKVFLIIAAVVVALAAIFFGYAKKEGYIVKTEMVQPLII